MAAACWKKHGKPQAFANQQAFPQDGVRELALKMKQLESTVQRLLEQVSKMTTRAQSGTVHGMDFSISRPVGTTLPKWGGISCIMI